jgi:hypothetical protein
MSTRKFTTNDIYDLNLHLRLKNDTDALSLYLHRNAPDGDRSFFAIGLLHNLVANAIDHIGKKKIANEVRALGGGGSGGGDGSSMTAEKFLNVAGRVDLISAHVLDDGSFSRFCNALGLSPMIALALQHDRVSRGYLALCRWYGLKIRSVGDLVAVLEKFAPSLIGELGLDSYRSTTNEPQTASTMNLDDQHHHNPLASGFEAANAVTQAAAFIRDTDNVHLQDICTVFNKTEKYAQLLSLFGVQPSVESNKRLAELRERWLAGRLTGKRGNPALTILTDLCASPKFASLPLDEMAAKLMKCDSQEVQTVVANWIAAIADQHSALQVDIQSSVDQHDELREFFTKSGLAANEAEVQQFINRLTHDDIDVHKLAHMRRMTAEDFRAAGFSLRLSKDIAATVQEHFNKK